MKLMIGCLVGIAATNAFAIPLDCAEDKATNAYFCFAQSELREVNGIRSAPLYTGGPNGVQRTAFTAAANCGTGALHLKDRQGVSFAGAGLWDSTPQSRALRQNICAAALPTTKKKRP